MHRITRWSDEIESSFINTTTQVLALDRDRQFDVGSTDGSKSGPLACRIRDGGRGRHGSLQWTQKNQPQRT